MKKYIKYFLLSVMTIMFALFTVSCGASEVDLSSDHSGHLNEVTELNEPEVDIDDEDEAAESEKNQADQNKQDKEAQAKEKKESSSTKKEKNAAESVSPPKETDQTNKPSAQQKQKQEETKQQAPTKKQESNPSAHQNNEKKEDKQPAPPKKPSTPKDTVTISIETGSVQGTILPQTKIDMNPGDTVLDVTRKITKDKGIQISIRGSGDSGYVEGIGNLYEFDEGPLSGWMVKVNGTTIDRGAGAYQVNKDQQIQWIYVLNYLEES